MSGGSGLIGEEKSVLKLYTWVPKPTDPEECFNLYAGVWPPADERGAEGIGGADFR